MDNIEIECYAGFSYAGFSYFTGPGFRENNTENNTED